MSHSSVLRPHLNQKKTPPRVYLLKIKTRKEFYFIFTRMNHEATAAPTKNAKKSTRINAGVVNEIMGMKIMCIEYSLLQVAEWVKVSSLWGKWHDHVCTTHFTLVFRRS